MSSTNELCGCVDDEECMIDNSCTMGKLGCNVHGKMYCRLCEGEIPLDDDDPDYLDCVRDAAGRFNSEEECLGWCGN